MPPAEGRKPIPVIDVRGRAGAALAATGAEEGGRADALAGGVGGIRALGGGGFATIETVGSEARARSTSSRDAPLSACATRWGAGFGAAAIGAVAGAGERCAAGGGGVCATVGGAALGGAVCATAGGAALGGDVCATAAGAAVGRGVCATVGGAVFGAGACAAAAGAGFGPGVCATTAGEAASARGAGEGGC